MSPRPREDPLIDEGPAGSGRLVVCLPFSGGSADSYRPWLRGVADAEVVPVHLPGRFRRAGLEPVVDLARLAARIAGEIRMLDPTRPVILLGHSMGAILAFETARLMAASAPERLCGLVVSGVAAPHVWRPDTYDPEMSDRELIDLLVGWGGTPAEILGEPELLDLVLTSLRLDLRTCAGYRYSEAPPLTIPLVALAGSADAEAPPHDVGQWAQHTTHWGGLSIHPGGHFFLAEAVGALPGAISRVGGPWGDGVRVRKD